MSKNVSLDAILLSVEAVLRWHQTCSEAVSQMKTLIEKGKLAEPEISQEQAVANSDGSLTIFVDIPNFRRIQLTIAPDQWEYIS